MPKLQIALVTVGSLRERLDFALLKGWQSDLVEIKHAADIGNAPDAIGRD